MLELRPLSDDDISLVEVWLNKEHIKRWYEIPHIGITIADWMREIQERNGEFRWITYLIAMYREQPIGLCLYYKCTDSNDEDFGTLPPAGSYGIDYLIGEETYLGKCLGKRIIAMLVDKIFSFTDAERVTAEIDKDNKASEKALLSCGFTLLDVQRSRYVIRKD
ncbi:MAG TPA: N-acetyltransferase [Clostridiales bacterium]|nr:N-acetyltransferase [Clostridiales bacterium]